MDWALHWTEANDLLKPGTLYIVTWCLVTRSYDTTSEWEYHPIIYNILKSIKAETLQRWPLTMASKHISRKCMSFNFSIIELLPLPCCLKFPLFVRAKQWPGQLKEAILLLPLALVSLAPGHPPRLNCHRGVPPQQMRTDWSEPNMACNYLLIKIWKNCPKRPFLLQ